MKYKLFLRTCLLALWAAVLPAQAQLPELAGCIVGGIGTDAAELQEGQWYLMYNRGRKAFAGEKIEDRKMYASKSAFALLADAGSADVCRFLVRLESDGGGGYYLQTGTGYYFGALVDGSAGGGGGKIMANVSDKAAASAYTCGTIANTAGHFFLNDAAGVILDCNESGGTLAGWGTGSVGNLNGNADWAFRPVTLKESSSLLHGRDLIADLAAKPTPVRLFNKLYPTHVMCVADGVVKIAEKAAGDLSQIWLFAPSGDGFTLRNAKTGMLINHPAADNTPAPTSRTPQVYYASAWAGNEAYVVFSTAATVTGHTCLHEGASNNVVRWVGTADSQASAWAVEPADDVSADEIKASFNCTPEDGKYYQLYNKSTSLPLVENGGRLACAAAAAGTFGQYWKLTRTGDGFTLRNLGTGRYASQPDGNPGSVYVTADADGATAFVLTQRNLDKDLWLDTYTLADAAGNLGLLCDASHNVVRGDCENDAASAWYFVEADIDRNTLGRAEFMWEHPDGGLYRLDNHAGHNTTWSKRYLTDTGGGDNLSVADSKKDSGESLQQVWQMQPAAGGGYTLRNMSTGRYVPVAIPENSGEPSADSPGMFYVTKSEAGDDYVLISSAADFSGKTLLHHAADHQLVSRDLAAAGDDFASSWKLEEIDEQEYVREGIRDKLSQFDGHYPVNEENVGEGKFYFISNNYYGSVIYGNPQSGSALCMKKDATNFTQMWELIPGEDGETYALRNALTGLYIQRKGNGSLSQVYTTGKSASYFNLTDCSGTYLYDYAIFDAYKNGAGVAQTDRGLHCDAGGSVVGWFTNAAASIWHFERIEPDAEALTEARAKYEESQHLNETVSIELLETFFTDAACTELREAYAGMDDATLREAMSALPESVQEMALKVKNNTWETYADGWDKTERTWRIAQYKAYSDNVAWAGKIGAGYVLGRLSNPTGINVAKGDLVTIYVGNDAPAGTEIKLEVVTNCNSTGEQMKLKKGMNAIFAQVDASLFIFYNVTETTKKLADVAPVTIHIEGGSVNGFFDATRGHTDADWQKMQQYLLKAENLQLKTEKIVFLMPRKLVTEACPEHMTGLLGVWNNILKMQHRLMAADDFADYFNCVLTACAVDHNYMYASSYGTYYHTETLSEVMNYEKMRTTGAIWGPAHENGHVNQQLINMIGCTEISNNAFSNVAVYEQGYITSRTSAPAEMFGDFAAGVNWEDRNLWQRTRLYWQLYMYYHLQGHKPDFYPALFRALRTDPMIHRANTPVAAADDYLKFAVKCCQVAGEDLSEFFEVYGFFEPLSGATQKCGDRSDCKLIDDYGNYYLYVTPEMISDAKAKMKACGPARGNILFIDDRIELTENKDGSGPRSDWNGRDIAGGYYGDMGQYSDFTGENDCDGYLYTMDEEGHISVEGEGAVGVKIYDAETGELLYVSNENDFTLPESVREVAEEHGIEVKAAAGNGEDVSIPDKTGLYYTLDAYCGSSSAKVIHTEAKTESQLPALPANAIAVLRAEGHEPEGYGLLAGAANVVIDGTAAKLVLTDKVAFYAPASFHANTLTYARTNTAGWNSVCLPFPVSTADFGEGSQIAKLSSVSRSGSETIVSFDDSYTEAAAGEPCLIYCPENFDSWSLEKTNVDVVGMPASAAAVSAPDVMMCGSFANTPIGAGKYKLNSDGTAFGVTSDAGTVTAFRAYVEGRSLGAQLRTIFFNGGQTTGAGIAPAEVSKESKVYDLSGRLVPNPVKGSLYIVNGKKCVW